ncbi:hypothetical protein F4677DRAFT_341410 [Hypoxylon crocopeplum]|nr:hypothetical protein F4677DRAFT_341410 [Hypoxylon crocopeplum]
MIAFGFSWYSWTKDERLGTAQQIRAYLQTPAESCDIDKKSRFNHTIISADRRTLFRGWSVTVTNGQGEMLTYCAKFVVLATGCRNYQHPLEITIPGLGNFDGLVVHLRSSQRTWVTVEQTWLLSKMVQRLSL